MVPFSCHELQIANFEFQVSSFQFQSPLDPSRPRPDTLDDMTEEGIRLDKYLADCGVASRRRSAELVRQGRVQVDGATADEPGVRIDPQTSDVSADGKPVKAPRRLLTIKFYKPRGVICSTNAKQGRTIYECLHDVEERVVPAGRLDKDSEGLLILSNDGDLVHRLTHPRFEHAKTYRVSISGHLDASILQRLNQPMTLDGYCIRPARVSHLRATSDGRHELLEFTLKEGRNRQIRKMCDRFGLRIHRLVRTEVAGIRLTPLKPGGWQELSAAERAAVRQYV